MATEASNRAQHAAEARNKREIRRNAFRKTKLCKFHQLGSCTFGEDCTYAHDAGQLATPPDLTRTRLCSRYSRKGGCPAGETCKFAHGEAQLRSKSPKMKQPSANGNEEKGHSDRQEARTSMDEIGPALLERLHQLWFAQEQAELLQEMQELSQQFARNYEMARLQREEFQHRILQILAQLNAVEVNFQRQSVGSDTATPLDSSDQTLHASSSRPAWKGPLDGTSCRVSSVGAPVQRLADAAGLGQGQFKQFEHMFPCPRPTGNDIRNDILFAHAPTASPSESNSDSSSATRNSKWSQQSCSRQTTLDLYYTRQTTPAEEFGDSPYGTPPITPRSGFEGGVSKGAGELRPESPGIEAQADWHNLMEDDVRD